MVATMPVSAIASASQRLPKRPAHEVARGDVAVLAAHVPQPRKHQEQERIDDDRVGHGEERHRAGAERERRNGDEGVGGVDVAADQEPGDDGAEAPAAQAPFVQQIQVARRQCAAAKPSQVISPNSSTKMLSAIQFISCTMLPSSSWRGLVAGRQVDHRGEHRADDHPQHLVPVEERDADPARFRLL
jgi:hypothetical protein